MADQFPTPLEIRALAEDYGYSERREEVSSTLFFRENNPSNPSCPILINVFYTTRGLMTHLPHPTQGYNSLWRSSAYDSLEGLAMLFEDPRTHTGKGYRQKKNAVRGCAKCGDQKKRTEYSANQWKAGPGKSICSGCVGGDKKGKKQNKENGGNNANAGTGGGSGSDNSDNYDGSFPRLTADALQEHNKKQMKKVRGNVERRQFNCPTCPEEGRGKNIFFKKVPADKPIVKCPKCKKAKSGQCERLYPIPKGEEKGYGLYRCSTCDNTWGSSRAVGNIGQECHVCAIAGNSDNFVKPFRIEAIRVNKGGRRMKRQPREPIGEDEEATNAYSPTDAQRFQSNGGNALVGGGAGGGAGSSFDWVEMERDEGSSAPETAPAASRLSQYKPQHRCEGCATGVCRSRKLPISGIHDVHDGDTVSTSASFITNSEVDKSEFVDRDIDFDDWEEDEGGEVWVTIGPNGKMLRG